MCRVALICAKPRPTDAIERGCVEKAPTATGELPDGVMGKRAQFGLGSGGELREPRRGNANRLRGDCRRKVLWEVDAVRPGSVVVDLGSRVERGANGPRRTLSQTGACEWGTYEQVITRPCRRHEEPDEAQGALRPSLPRTRYGVSRLSIRVRRARLNPSTASRSGKALIPVGPTVRRAALDPMQPFLGLGWTLQVSRAGNAGKA